MLILFDHGTPWPLRHYLVGHTVHRAYQFGWDTLPDGHLIANAEASGYELLITTDLSIQHQQNLARREIAILVLIDHNWPYSTAAIADIVAAVGEMSRSEYRELELL